MLKIYDPKTIERKWNNLWYQSNCFTVNSLNAIKTDNTFCIMLPPPNVTGSLHMGHAFQHTMMDLLVRLKRMQGKKVLWQAGLDHAGISTQMVVERQLGLEGIKRADLSKDDFLAKVWEWKDQSSNVIINQMKRFGTAIDWSIAKFTLDPDFCTAVKKVFVQLYREGLITKGKKLINWDPTLQTAISDLEVITEEFKGDLWYIKYPVVDSEEYITIATTRPETLLGDVAVCVNPLDQRYLHLIGKKVKLPIVNRQIPIIADEYVDQNFGSGCLKITPAHDINDYNLSLKHKLPLINILNKDLTLNKNVPLEFRGLEKLTARKLILEILQQQQLLVKVEDCVINLPRSASTNAIVEPLLTDQWFLKMEELAKPAIELVKNGTIKFIPSEWANNYLEWLNNIQDWCISRQLWWGHQIPAWYDQHGNIYVGEDLATVRKFYNLPNDLELIQDPDVLDTWFSSALWPFVTLGWPENTNKFKSFFPTDVLVTGFDIIFFWVARMVMLSLKFTKEIPFKTVYIHGIIQDQEGQKMSKTKGNVIDPIDLVEGISLSNLIIKRTTGLIQPQQKENIELKTKKQFPNGINCFGTDALRFTFCAIATHSRHIKFELLRLEGYRNFCNKLWNAARFVLLHLGEQQLNLNNIDIKLFENCIYTQWILSKWQQVKLDFIEYINNYRFDLASKLIYDFVWNEYCDWYLEFTKVILLDQIRSLDKVIPIKLGLILVLDEILKILHPIMPYITEEIWQVMIKFKKCDLDNHNLLIDQSYPAFTEQYINLSAENCINWIKKFIIAIRTLKSSLNISMGTKLSEVFIDHNLHSIEQQYLLKNQNVIKAITKIDKIIITDDPSTKKGSAVSLVNNIEVWVVMKGLIDPLIEKDRLNKEIQKLTKILEIVNKKLNNLEYLNHAPKEIVIKEQQKQIDLQTAINKLATQIKEITINL